MIIVEPQSKWWSLNTTQLVFSEVCFINFFHICRMAFISCNRQKWSSSWRAYSVFKTFQFLSEPSEWNSWVIKLTKETFVLMKTSWRRLSSSSSDHIFKTSWSRRICSPHSCEVSWTRRETHGKLLDSTTHAGNEKIALISRID